MAISTAPPPGTRRGSSITLRATPIASCRLRSTCARQRRQTVSVLAPKQATNVSHPAGAHCHVRQAVTRAKPGMPSSGAWFTRAQLP